MMRAVVLLSIGVVMAVVLMGCDSLRRPSLECYGRKLPATEIRQGVTAQFFGTTTILIRHDENAILIDGFFSRPSLLRTLFWSIAPDEERIEEALKHVCPRKIDLLLVAHSHHDHAMDAPTVAAKTGATLVGSESTLQILRGSKFCDVRFQLITPHVPIAPTSIAGTADLAYRVTAFPSPHGPHPRWLERMLVGNITKPLTPPVRATRYKYGGNFNFFIEIGERRILVVPSANVPLNLGDTKADVVFLSIGNLNKLTKMEILEYWERAVEKTEAKLVIPVHWDDFTLPLEEPLQAFRSIMDDTACAMETLTYLNQRRVDIAFMPLFDTVSLDDALKKASLQRAANDAQTSVDPFTSGCRAGKE